MKHIPSGLLLLAAACVMSAQATAASPLAEAAAAGDMRVVRSLIKKTSDINAPSRDGTPALHWVVRMQDLDLTGQLLRAGADANLANRYGVRPLHLAIDNDDVASVRLLLGAGADPDATDSAGESSLMLAARSGRLDVVTALLDKGATVDQVDPEFQQTALMIAAREGHAPVVRLLIERGADVNAQTRAAKSTGLRPPGGAGSKGKGIIRGGVPERGSREQIPGAKTPLLYAARQGHLEIVRLLLGAGADIEKAEANAVTPLLMAIMNNHISVATYLVEQGADVRAVDWYGHTPLFVAVDLRNIDVPGPTRDNGVDRDSALRLIKLLIERGADLNARTREYPPQRRFINRLGYLSWVDFTGQTSFLRAAFSGDVTVMRLLVEHGADPSIPTFAGTTPLMAAAGINWTVAQTFDEGPQALLEAVKFAHSLGNDVNAENSMGLRAIHGAANRGSDEIIRFLVERGAALDARDREGRTPLDWAQGVFLATHPPEVKPKTVDLLKALSTSRLSSR